MIAFPSISQSHQLVHSLVELAAPEAIFLLGYRTCQYAGYSIFASPEKQAGQLAHCYLLVLLPGSPQADLHQWQEKIENRLRHQVPLTAMVLSTGTFLEWVGENHPFALHTIASTQPLYSAPGFILPMISCVPGAPGKEVEKQFRHNMQKAIEFMAGSELFRIRKQQPLAAFMLHQCAEQALSAFFLAATGYRLNTHNIDRLLSFAAMVAPALLNHLPGNTCEDKTRFQLLQKAYIHARYKNDYRISNEDLLLLTAKLRTMLDLLEQRVMKLFLAETK